MKNCHEWVENKKKILKIWAKIINYEYNIANTVAVKWLPEEQFSV